MNFTRIINFIRIANNKRIMNNKTIKIIFVVITIMGLIGCGGKAQDPGKNLIPSPIITQSPIAQNSPQNGVNSENPKQSTSPKQTGLPNQDGKTTTSPTVITESIVPNFFKFESVKKGDKVGAFAVDDIKKEESFTTVIFKGKTNISGTFKSDFAGMVGEFITINPDEKSKFKIPYLGGSKDFTIVLDPAFQKDYDFIKLFGKNGTEGSFEMELDEYLVTNWVESFERVGKVSKVINIKTIEKAK